MLDQSIAPPTETDARSGRLIYITIQTLVLNEFSALPVFVNDDELFEALVNWVPDFAWNDDQQSQDSYSLLYSSQQERFLNTP